MDYELSKPQKMLQQSVREFCGRQCTADHVREIMETETAHHAELWQGVADQGWIGLHLPEEHGGLGLGLVDLAVVFEEVGRACLPGPFLSSTWAATLISKTGHAASVSSILPELCEGSKIGTVACFEEEAGWVSGQYDAVKAEVSGDGLTLSGKKQLVADAAVADVFVVAARGEQGLTLVLVESSANGINITPTEGLDATRKLYEVTFDIVNVSADNVMSTGADAERALKESQQVGMVAVCAELVGSMQWMLEECVEYAKTRKQFDKIIGSFQAIQHKCADILLTTESSRSAMLYAAWALSEGTDDAERAVSIAKLFCSDAGQKVGGLAIQVHGGIGFTWEHDLHLFYKRNKSNEFLFGDATFHRELVARLALDAA